MARTDATDGAPANPEFADATRGIYDEIGWFASDYERVLQAYLESVEKARAPVARVRTQGDVNENTIDVIERAVERLLSTARERVLPHLNVDGSSSPKRAVTSTWRARSPTGATSTEPRRNSTARDLLDNVGGQRFVNRNMSRTPVRNRLLSFLRGDRAAGGELFEVWEPESRFTTYAYEGSSHLEEEASDGPFDEQDRERYASRFGPALSGERRGAVYVLARRLPDRSNQPDPLTPEAYPSNALVVQAFTDEATTAAARQALVEDGPLTVEGETQLGDATVGRIYYSGVGDVVYAFLFHTAEFLIVVAPSEVAWNERVNWSAGLRRTWLWAGG